MIVNAHVRDYINSLGPALSESLCELEEKAVAGNVPIIRKDMQGFLVFLLKTRRPEHILEIGTAIGFSTLLIYENTGKDCRIDTIEKVEMRLSEARKNLEGKERIRLLEGDAGEILGRLESCYDFIFLDAAKGQYQTFLPDIERLLAPGGILVTDNVLLEGSVAESKFSIERRDRTIHMRMREYLYAVTHSDTLESTVLPIGDGVAVSIKKG